MTSINKTIRVNPDLFKFTSLGQTRKNKQQKTKPTPIISPNNLKNKLLKRIQQHKNNEINELNQKNKDAPCEKYTDDFYDAIGYLSDLSKKHKIQNTQNKTFKNFNPMHSIETSPHVELDLPPELQESFFNNIQSESHFNPIKLNYKVDNIVPHGCLRGGQKPTYRNWQKTQKYYNPIQEKELSQNTLQQNVVQNVPQNLNLSREERLTMIKKKLKHLETKQTLTNIPNISIQTTPNNEQEIVNNVTFPFNANYINVHTPSLELNTVIPPNIMPINNTLTKNTNIQKENKEPNNNAKFKNKKYIKKTIRRKYTLGKSNVYRKVGVLIKNKQTRKHILNAQKELKQTPISEVKKYLHDHGIMKVGSIAPNNVLRQTYECSRLAGEINNTNKDILLHNFMKQENDA